MWLGKVEVQEKDLMEVLVCGSDQREIKTLYWDLSFFIWLCLGCASGSKEGLGGLLMRRPGQGRAGAGQGLGVTQEGGS